MFQIKRWKLYLLLFLAFFSFAGKAQYIFTDNHLPARLSLYKHASIIRNDSLTADQIIAGKNISRAVPVKEENLDLGFTEGSFWVLFYLDNQTANPLEYYLETARPITDLVELYCKIRQ